MINDLKLGLSLLRYAHGKGSGIAFSLAMLVLGSIFLILIPSEWQGNYFFFAVAMWPIQMLYSFSASDLILASPQGKRIQTSVTACIGFASYLVIFLIVFVIRLFQMNAGILSESLAGYQMILSCVISLFIFAYLGAALKYFISSTICFVTLFLCFSLYLQFFRPEQYFIQLELPFAVSALIGILFLFLCSLCQYGIALLVYKKPVSKRSQLSGLRKSM